MFEESQLKIMTSTATIYVSVSPVITNYQAGVCVLWAGGYRIDEVDSCEKTAAVGFRQEGHERAAKGAGDSEAGDPKPPVGAPADGDSGENGHGDADEP